MSNLCFWYTHWSKVKLSVAQAHKYNWVLLYLHFRQKPSIVSTLITFKSSLGWLPVYAATFWRWGWGGVGVKLPQTPSMCLFLNYVWTINHIPAKVASWLFPANGSTDHGFPHGFWHQHRPWALHNTTDSDKALGGRHHHGPLRQDRPVLSIWPPVAAWPTEDLIFFFFF